MAPFACNGCDLERAEPGLAHCPDCNEVTETYVVNRDGLPGEVYTTRVDFSKVDLRPDYIQFGFVREASTGLIHLGDERAAA